MFYILLGRALFAVFRSVFHQVYFLPIFAFQSPLEKGLLFFPYPANIEAVDRDLLPAHHEVSVFPRRELPVFIVFSAILFVITAMLAFLTHQVHFFSFFSKTVVDSLNLIFAMNST